MNINVLGDRKRVRYDESLIDIVNAKYANVVIAPEVHSEYDFEQRAYRLEGRERKHRLDYNSSLIRIKEAGYERHLTCKEHFSILLKLYNDDCEEANKLLNDMTFDYGEWLSHQFKTEDDESLSIYFNPFDITAFGNFKYESKKTIPARRLNSVARGQLIDFGMFGNEFLEFMFGIKVEDFPEQLCKGKNRLKIRLPTYEEGFCPVSIGNYHEKFALVAHPLNSRLGFDSKRASRGIREDPIKKSVDNAINNFPQGGII